MKFRTLFNWVFPPLRTYEILVLESVASACPPPIREFLHSQIRGINYVQRNSEDREVNFYTFRHGEVYNDVSIRLPAGHGAVRFAQATIQQKPPTSAHSEIASVVLVDGYLFSLMFPTKPSNYRTADLKVISVQINPIVLDGAANNSAAVLSAPAREQNTFGIQSNLPADYSQLIQQQTIAPNGIAILPLENIYEIPIQNSIYYVVATLHGSAIIAVKRGESDGSTYILAHDEPPRKAGNSVNEAVEELKKTYGET